jgi:hypothetical protein
MQNRAVKSTAVWAYVLFFREGEVWMPMVWSAGKAELVLAAGMQNGEDHQIGVREKPFLGADASGFSCADQFAEMLVMGEGVQVIEANTRQAGYLILGECLLARLDTNHPAAS